MPLFEIRGEVTVSCRMRIMADDDGQALEIARKMRDEVYLTASAPGGYDWSDGFFVEEADGTVCKFRVEAVEQDDQDDV